MKTKRFLTVLLVIAVMFTFSFSSAFAALPYEGTTTVDKPVATEGDFVDGGKIGLSTVAQKALTVTVENAKADEAGQYPAELQKKVDAAYDTAIAAVKAAKTSKEMYDALEAGEKTLDKLGLDKNSYEALAKAFAKEDGADGVEYDAEAGYYMIPGYGLLTVGETKKVSVGVTEDGKYNVVFKWLMDQGYYGYSKAGAWEETLVSRTVKNAVADWLDGYYVGEYTFDQVRTNEEVTIDNEKVALKVSNLTKYGRKVYAEYLDVLEAIAAYDDKKAVTIDEYVAVIDKINAFVDKYNLEKKDVTGAAAFATIPAFTADNELYIATDKWYIDNLEDAVEAIEKINTAAGYTAAKADIIAAAKKVVDVEDKYGDYPEVVEAMLGNAANTVKAALVEIMKADAIELDKACDEDAYTPYKVVSTDAQGNALTATFDDSADNLAAIEAARKAFDAYLADYTFAYEAYAQEDTAGIPEIVELVAYEVPLLAAEYNKTAVPATADKETAEKNAKVQAWLNNATVKVTTQALGKGKIRVQAKIDADSFEALAGYTIEYKFYKKTAKAASYKGYSDRAVNYTTFTKLTKGTKYNFKCAVTVKDKDGNVVATKGYLGSTTGIRTAK